MIVFCIMFGALFYHFNGEFNGRFRQVDVVVAGHGHDDRLRRHRPGGRTRSRVFTIFFMLFSVIISAAGDRQHLRQALAGTCVREKKATAALERLDFTMLKHMDKDGDGIGCERVRPVHVLRLDKVTGENVTFDPAAALHRYVIGMLQMLELVDPGRSTCWRKAIREP